MNQGQQLPPAPASGSGRMDRDDWSDEIDLARLWAVIRGGRWKIAACIALAILGAIFYLFVAQPQYRADALLQIETEGSSPLSGLSSELGQLTGKNTSPAQSEISIIKSRSVLGATVDALHLQTHAAPKYFPVIGESIAARRDAPRQASTEDQLAAPEELGWFPQFVWQPAEISVTRMEVPQDLMGTPFTLRAIGGDGYRLYGPDGEAVLTGEVGQPAEGKTRTGHSVRIFVRALQAGGLPVDFSVVPRAWLSVVEDLQRSLSVSERGDDTGVVSISLEGTERDRITTIVNEIAETYLRQNVEAKSKEAEKSLEFLDEQLPELRSEVRAAETKLAEYREEKKAIDLTAEAQALLDQVVSLEDKRSQLQMKFAELRQRYTGDHPALTAAREQMERLQQEREQIESQVGRLPDAQKEILRLQRDLEVNTQLYTELIKRAQELRVVKAGTIGNVRIIDSAVRPVKAVSPRSALVFMLSLLLGGMFGLGLIFVQMALRRGVNDPGEIEKQLGLSVYAVVPFSPWLHRQTQRARRRREAMPLLARDRGDEVGVEALRSFRTSLYFAQMDAESNIILFTGPAPGVGKSFISMNLAYLLSDIGQKVVVVDGDLRKGRLHEFTTSRSREPGLSQVISGQATLDEALHTIEGSRINLITTGQLPPNPSELLMRKEFRTVMEDLKQRFDLVLIDVPPILAVTDAAIIAGSMPGIVPFMVARAGVHPMAEIEESVKRMAQTGAPVAGVIFNGLTKSHADNAGAYQYYQYEYKARG
ncbi:polysaccharide biosynthesis tyrosine autokinase [Spectribacter hydrogenooxidans]|uniref:Polysaccharide biosynthesis tyrosine autokinase n=1 Tax=Spectribacter hydrogenoxidans TaxID=3075608 RepID=A0ABU3BXA8_9GAMM|nr:polysaccharide biosynthesis tyrosine autokinase [Salinisphaera sp. W335]MDT0633942.1 polysaccharide biosynthesis tyrosine autokinase [Salinisphaera sp. W335]